MTTQTINSELVQYAIDGMANIQEGQEACDLHNALFNMDYFIIGCYQAEQWLIANPGIFAAIEEIKTYEQDNFGEVTTDLSSSEKVVNMYAYIKGEEILMESKTLQARWNKKLTSADIKKIIKELKELL
jgi:hypothetical protein